MTGIDRATEGPDRDEAMARALLTIATVETAVGKLERYLVTNGEYLPLDAKVPLRAQCEVMRAALDKWKVKP